MNGDRIVYDETLELNVIGGLLLGHGMPDVSLRLTARDFWLPKHQLILAAIQGLLHRGEPVDAITVTAYLQERDQLRQVGGAVYIHQTTAELLTSAFVPAYAERLRLITRKRLLDELAVRTHQVALSGGGDWAEVEDEWTTQIWKHLDDIPRDLWGDRNAALSLRDLLERPVTEVDWIIPGWLARKERAVIVAAEGVSKSTMLRQFSVCIAGGLNPWTAQRVAPGRKVLFIDAENSEDQSVRAFHWVASRCWRRWMDDGWDQPGRFGLKTSDAGLNLAGRDSAWFRDTVAEFQPDVLVLTPAYKLMVGKDPKDDGDMLALFAAIDEVRVRHNCAVLIEQHAPYGQGFQNRDMRPFGSSVWLRWPEVGIGFQRDTDVPPEHQKRRPEALESVDWRGAREPRDWPDRIQYGGPKDLPWVPTDPRWRPSVPPIYDEQEGAA